MTQEEVGKSQVTQQGGSQMQRMRKQRVSALLVLGFMAATVLTAGPAQAASGNGPYYAEPAWAQKLPAATRFVVLTDWNSDAVLDRHTGLVWEKAPDATPEIWTIARFSCLNRTTGGQKGWRLPAIAELASLIDPSVNPPGRTLPPGHPFVGVLPTFYWSATTDAESSTGAWDVDFNNGLVFAGNKSKAFQVWCVRGGSNADQY
jgi:hypothetical protein